MSVATQLGLNDPARGLLAEARTDWAGWRGNDPRLAVVDDLLELPDWIHAAGRNDVDDVLHVLASAAPPGATTSPRLAHWPGCYCPGQPLWPTGCGT